MRREKVSASPNIFKAHHGLEAKLQRFPFVFLSSWAKPDSNFFVMIVCPREVCLLPYLVVGSKVRTLEGGLGAWSSLVAEQQLQIQYHKQCSTLQGGDGEVVPFFQNFWFWQPLNQEGLINPTWFIGLINLVNPITLCDSQHFRISDFSQGCHGDNYFRFLHFALCFLDQRLLHKWTSGQTSRRDTATGLLQITLRLFLGLWKALTLQK